MKNKVEDLEAIRTEAQLEGIKVAFTEDYSTECNSILSILSNELKYQRDRRINDWDKNDFQYWEKK